MRHCFLIMTLLSVGACSQQAPSLDAAFAMVQTAVAKDEVPGAIGIVTQHGRVLRQEAFGHADMARTRPMTPRTICWIASITKPVTVAAAMTLVEAGKVSLDDPVANHLPAFRVGDKGDRRRQDITIRQLMSHRSGIPMGVPLRPEMFFEKDWLAQDIANVAREVANTPLKFKPGAGVQYSNAAPYVLARIIEARSGMRFDRYVKKAVLDPLDMHDTFFAIPITAAPRVADVRRREDGRDDYAFFQFDPTWRMNMAMPDGGLFSTAADIARFAETFIRNDGRVLSKKTVRDMLTDQGSGWGLGWGIEKDGGFYHFGSSGTLVWANPTTGVVGALFCQVQDYKTKAHASQALRKQFRQAVAKAISDATPPTP